MKTLVASIVVALAAFGCAPQGAPTVTTRDLVVGQGEPVRRHSTVSIHYSGWLVGDGRQFDTSRQTDAPLTFTVDAGEVVPGLDMGVTGMRPGGTREIVMPHALAYGPRGMPPAIPPNADLRFEVELLEVRPPQYANLSTGQISDHPKAKLIDVRTPEEWRETGIVPGSLMLTAFDKDGRFRKDFPEKLAELVGRDGEVVLICRSGNRSATMAHLLTTKLGYAHVFNVEAGIKAWIKEGRQLDKVN